MRSKKPVFYLTASGKTDPDDVARKKEALIGKGYRVITLWEGCLPPEKCIEKILQNRFRGPETGALDGCSRDAQKGEETR